MQKQNKRKDKTEVINPTLLMLGKIGFRLLCRGDVGYVSSPTSQFSLTFMNSPVEFLLELGRHCISLAMGFKILR